MPSNNNLWVFKVVLRFSDDILLLQFYLIKKTNFVKIFRKSVIYIAFSFYSLVVLASFVISYSLH